MDEVLKEEEALLREAGILPLEGNASTQRMLPCRPKPMKPSSELQRFADLIERARLDIEHFKETMVRVPLKTGFPRKSTSPIG